MPSNPTIPGNEYRESESAILRELVAKWQELQEQIDALQAFESVPGQAGRLREIDELEEALQNQQDRITREIIDTKCLSMPDVMLKLDLWQTSQRLGSSDLSGFSLTDQIGLSINTEAFR